MRSRKKDSVEIPGLPIKGGKSRCNNQRFISEKTLKIRITLKSKDH